MVLKEIPYRLIRGVSFPSVSDDDRMMIHTRDQDIPIFVPEWVLDTRKFAAFDSMAKYYAKARGHDLLDFPRLGNIGEQDNTPIREINDEGHTILISQRVYQDESTEHPENLEDFETIKFLD